MILNMLLEFINTKTKAYIVFVFSAIALGIMTITTFLGTLIVPKWYGVIIGIILMLGAIPLHRLARKRSEYYIISFLLNSVGCGFSVAAYYRTTNINVELFQIFFAIVPVLAISFFTYLCLQHFKNLKKIILFIATVLLLVLVIYAMSLWTRTGAVLYSYGFFSLVLILFYLGVYGVTVNKSRPVLRDISYGSFGSFIILTVVIVVILSDGELDGFDGIDVGGSSGKKQKRNKTV